LNRWDGILGSVGFGGWSILGFGGEMRVLCVWDGQKEGVHTVRVSNVSAKATEHDIQDFFSFSGEIEQIELHK